MNVKDITTLLSKGYKPGDIKAIGEMAKDNREILELAKSTTNIEELKALSELIEEDTAGKSDNSSESEYSKVENNSERGESDPTPNYKELYENSQKEIEKLKKKVDKIQEDNSREDNSGKAESNENALSDFARAIFT